MRTLWVGMLALVIAVAVAGCKGKTEGKKKTVVPTTPPAGAVRPATSPAGSVDVATEAAAAALEAAAIAQKTCPVMEGPINPKIFTDYEGRRIYFCCQGCVDDFKKDPAKYMAKVDEQLKAAPKPEAPESK